LANRNGQNNNVNNPDDRDEQNLDIGGQSDPAFEARLRNDIVAAIGTSADGEFRSRRTDIMAQIRAEARSRQPDQTPFTAVAATASRQPTPDAEREPANLTEFRERRSGFRLPAWAGALAASLVVIIIAAIIFTNNQNPQSPQTMSGAVAPTSRVATTAAATTAAAATTSASGTNDAFTGATNPAPDSSAARIGTTAAAAAGVAQAPSATTAAAGATTAASATTAAAATTVAATMAAGSTTTAAASAATAPPAATPGMGTGTGTGGGLTLPPVEPPVSNAESLKMTLGPFLRFAPTLPVTVTEDNLRGIRDFVRFQAATFAPGVRNQQRLNDADIASYKIEVNKGVNIRTAEVVAFYRAEATRLGYTVVETPLQNDNNVQVRLLNLTRATERLNILVVEVANNTTMNITDFATIRRGETGVFLLTP
jgi:hypothetical protein